MTDDCASPAICRSNAGRGCTDEPCTTTSGPLVASARPLLHMESLTSPDWVFFTVQCSLPAGFASWDPTEKGSAEAARPVPAARRKSLRSVIKEKAREFFAGPFVVAPYFGIRTSVT